MSWPRDAYADRIASLEPETQELLLGLFDLLGAVGFENPFAITEYIEETVRQLQLLRARCDERNVDARMRAFIALALHRLADRIVGGASAHQQYTARQRGID